MNRVRALMIKSSRKVARPFQDTADRLRTAYITPVVALDAVRRRLELLLASMYGSRFELVPLALAQDIPTNVIGVRKKGSFARSEGTTIELPSVISAIAADGGTNAAIAKYRLLAIEQAARIMRGSSAFAPADDDPIARDLYSIREAAAIDAELARQSPGLATLLNEERARALLTRKSLARLSTKEQQVERMLLSVLRSDAASPPSAVGASNTPQESLAWARTTSGAIAALKGKYRSRPPIAVWGATLENDADASRSKGASQGPLIPPSPGFGSGHSPMPYGGGDDDAQETSPEGTNAPKSADNADRRENPENADDPTDPPKDGPIIGLAPPVHDGRAAARIGGPTKLNQLDSDILAASRAGDGILYPEWDCNAGEYRALGAVVCTAPAPEGDLAWADRTLAEYPALVRRVRREFERLKARRMRLLRQRAGDELDLDACVRALADAAAGDASGDRLYVATHAARRAIAISVLVDASGSTKDEVADGRRVIDVEKTTLLLASEAFDALGDAYSIQTFASGGATDVRVATLKSFDEPNGETVRRRIAGVEAGGNTRLGAAIRHATAGISAQPAGHRLLLILSDGKPNDVDRYFTTYAVEDTRQAVFEARAAGVYPFCLTIDAEDPESYLGRVFGAAGYAILRRPEQLPTALVDLVREFLRGGGAH